MILQVVNKIKNDAALSSYLAKWNFGNGDEPSVHTKNPAPAEAPNPLCVVTTEGGEERSDVKTRNQKGWDHNFEINVWDDKNLSPARGRKIAERIFEIFSDQDESLPDNGNHKFLSMQISLPQQVIDREGYPGFVLSLRVTTYVERS